MTDGKKNTADHYYGYPTARLGLYYMVLQVAASLLEVALFPSQWAVLVINVLLLAFPIIGFITTRTLRKELARQAAKAKAEAAA